MGGPAETTIFGRHRVTPARGPAGFLFPRVSPDGRYLVVEVHSLAHSTIDGDIWIYDLKSGASRRLAAEGHSTRPAWSPDGRRVAFTSWVGDNTGVYIQPSDGGPAIRLRSGAYRIEAFRQVSWTPDMRWVIAAPYSDSTKNDILPNGDVILIRTPASAQDPVVMLNWFDQLTAALGRK
jgi:Tol biopolymer transport system component